MAAEVANGLPPRWLTLCGASGCGKTHLARELRQWAKAKMSYYRDPERGMSQLRPCCWIDSATLASELKNGNYGYATDHYDVWLLVIDDLGAERDTSGFLSEQMLRLLNARAGKWTIITSNLNTQQIKEQMDGRIADRLYRNGNIVVEVSDKTPSFAMRPPQEEAPTPAQPALATAFNPQLQPAKLNPHAPSST